MLILSFFLPQREPPLLFRFSLHFGKGMPLLFALFLLKLQRLLRLGADSGWAGQLPGFPLQALWAFAPFCQPGSLGESRTEFQAAAVFQPEFINLAVLWFGSERDTACLLYTSSGPAAAKSFRGRAGNGTAQRPAAGKAEGTA